MLVSYSSSFYRRFELADNCNRHRYIERIEQSSHIKKILKGDMSPVMLA
jgi:hypothetical protein